METAKISQLYDLGETIRGGTVCGTDLSVGGSAENQRLYKEAGTDA